MHYLIRIIAVFVNSGNSNSCKARVLRSVYKKGKMEDQTIMAYFHRLDPIEAEGYKDAGTLLAVEGEVEWGRADNRAGDHPPWFGVELKVWDRPYIATSTEPVAAVAVASEG
tara:strand:+ start:434 stop:769 length:336 start_codon:yes stop_codon:yes gene_type:complete